MAVHDNMTPSPERSSSKRKDDGLRRSPNHSKKYKMDEIHSSRSANCKEESSFDKFRKEDFRNSRGRSRSPIEEPSSSRDYSQSRQRREEVNETHMRESSAGRKYNKDDTHQYRKKSDSESNPNHKDSYQSSRSNLGSKEYQDNYYSRSYRDVTKSESPSRKYNESYSKPLPPGAKGSVYL